MIDEKRIPQRIYIKESQLAECEIEGVADARINAVPYKGGSGKLCEYINVDNLWHDASEKPQGSAAILYLWHDEQGGMDVGIDGVFDDLEWKKFVEYNKITKWCYINDILPKGGEK